MKNLHFIIVALASLACCTNRHSQSTKKENIPVIHTIDVQINEEPFLLKHKADDIKYITLEFSDKSLIDLITKLIFFEEYIVVLDNQGKTFLFNDKGSFVSEISEVGRGPGESLYATDILISETDSTFYIVDSGSPKLIIKDYNLNTLSEHKIPFYTWCLLKQHTDEYWFFMNNQVNDPSAPSNLIKTNSQLEILEYKLPIEFEDVGMTDYPSFSRIKNDEAIFTLPLDNNIYHLIVDDLFRHEISFGKHSLPEKFTEPLKQKFSNIRDKYKQHLDVFNHIYDFDYVANIMTVLENDKYIYFQFEKNKKWYAALFDKNKIVNNNGKVPTFFRRPLILNNENQLISVLYPYLFEKALDAEDKFITEELKRIIQDTGESSNPIIEIIELKE